jgi:superfamily II DNA or RNA helicase
MIRFGPGKDMDLSIAGKHLGARYRPELLAQNDRASGLVRRLYEENQPGVLLADEVGKGKTYVALAVAFARLTSRPRGHVLVLTHSGRMAGIWHERWQKLAECVGGCWRSRWNETDKSRWTARQYRSIDDLDSDASNKNLPHIAFASYETLKKYGSEEDDAGHLLDALSRSKRLIGLGLRNAERNLLIKDLVECDLRSVRRKPVSKTNAERILALLDGDTRWWKDTAYYAMDDVLDRIQARSRFGHGFRFDLLIIDEAHKLEGKARHRVVARLLHKRFDKCILVTATPFALSIHHFRKRLLDFGHARSTPISFEDSIGSLPLDDFRKAVAERVAFPDKEDLEKRLRRYMVRESWDHDRERTTEYWRGDASSEAILPTLLLERLVDGVLQSGQRTHIASRRESLCSSWPAARKSLEESPLRGTDRGWSRAFDAVVADRAALSDPKLLAAVARLVELVERDTKVVVFTQRLETSKALARLLRNHKIVQEKTRIIERHADRFRRHVDKVANWLNLDRAYAAGIVKIMAHSADRPKIDRSATLLWWRRHKKRLEDAGLGTWAQLRPIVGRGRRLPLFVRHDGETGSDERNIEKFNLPSSPVILIATPKAQEGIDLHHYCRHVVLFDLTWNPAAIEQRIGRVHRLGGIRKARDKVTVVYCFQKGTYEEVMAERVQQRCEMMQVLLGAGQWLDEDREVSELDRYRMTFPP